MSVKINALSAKELRTIGDAFGDYKYDDGEWGMRCVTTTRFLDGVKLYGLVYEPETMPMEWSSEAVLGIKTEVL